VPLGRATAFNFTGQKMSVDVGGTAPPRGERGKNRWGKLLAKKRVRVRVDVIYNQMG